MNLRDLERQSIRDFVWKAAGDGYLRGRVLDFGCGAQPYREIVENTIGAEYVGFDRPWFPGYVAGASLGPVPEELWSSFWDTVLCTQVVQYIPLVRYGADPEGSLQNTLQAIQRNLMVKSGHLVMTYPTNWPEVEPEDLHRFTKAGMERLLTEVGFSIVEHAPRAYMTSRDANLALGYGVIAQA